jgi:hypothetical protein
MDKEKEQILFQPALNCKKKKGKPPATASLDAHNHKHTYFLKQLQTSVKLCTIKTCDT